MDPQFRGAGGALEHLGQLGLSELDLLKLAASGGLNADAYTRSHSAEVARAQASAQQSTFSPSWPPHGSMGGGGADCDAAAVLARRGMPPLSPGSYLGGGALAGAGVLDHSPLGGAADLTYLAQLGAGATGVGPSAAFGEGPRIYVGGVPDLVTVAMVRDHFSRWGVVCVLPPPCLDAATPLGWRPCTLVAANLGLEHGAKPVACLALVGLTQSSAVPLDPVPRWGPESARCLCH